MFSEIFFLSIFFISSFFISKFLFHFFISYLKILIYYGNLSILYPGQSGSFLVEDTVFWGDLFPILDNTTFIIYRFYCSYNDKKCTYKVKLERNGKLYLTGNCRPESKNIKINTCRKIRNF